LANWIFFIDFLTTPNLPLLKLSIIDLSWEKIDFKEMIKHYGDTIVLMSAKIEGRNNLILLYTSPNQQKTHFIYSRSYCRDVLPFAGKKLQKLPTNEITKRSLKLSSLKGGTINICGIILPSLKRQMIKYDFGKRRILSINNY
jgi:hypothetical protein